MMLFFERLARWIDSFSDKTGRMIGWLTTSLVVIVFYDTIMRYAFKKGNVSLQEMEWHIFSVIFLLGAAYTLKQGGHVRVDIIFINLSDKAKSWVDFLGTLIFLIPFSIMVILASKGFVENSWSVREMSPDPGGLPARYILKAMIPFGFFLLLIQGISEVIKNFLVVIGFRKRGENG